MDFEQFCRIQLTFPGLLLEVIYLTYFLELENYFKIISKNVHVQLSFIKHMDNEGGGDYQKSTLLSQQHIINIL